ncbi:MAG: Gfo/Idh/MocA family oxidoreductase [Desulfarculaceae bacterium]|nr:Gfo/Idh/MocA family oxidoreductase [Desulfarculaceae bacterium]MCF8118296.1 Gfo/Idh/MocA family oxidoreductase [Desulfarculaceae bacterium]
MSTKLRMALIGAGHMGSVNATGIHKSGVAKVTGVVDRNTEAAQKVAKATGAEVLPSLDAVLEDSAVDAVFISVPHDLLAEFGRRAAEAGKHLIVEKPVAMSLDELDGLLVACRKNGVQLTSNYWLRYLPPVQRAAELVREGVLGDLVGMEIQVHQHKGAGYWAGVRGVAPDDWRGLRARAGGGMMIMTTCHALDYARYITGEDVVRVYSEYGALASPCEVEDIMSMTMRCRGGAVGGLTTCANMRGSRVETHRLWGQNGTMTFERERLSFYSTRRMGRKRPGRWHREKFPAFSALDGVTLLVQRFCEAVREGKTPEISPDDIWMNLAVVLATYQSMEDGCAVQVPSQGASRL